MKEKKEKLVPYIWSTRGKASDLNSSGFVSSLSFKEETDRHQQAQIRLCPAEQLPHLVLWEFLHCRVQVVQRASGSLFQSSTGVTEMLGQVEFDPKHKLLLLLYIIYYYI